MKKLIFFYFLIPFIMDSEPQARTITGQVFLTDEGEAIGANVVVDGNEGVGTVTEFDGTFSLEVPDEAKALKISYTGFTTQVVSIEDKDHVEVTLAHGELLEEVVVVGYNASRVESTVSSAAPIRIRGMASVSAGSSSDVVSASGARRDLNTDEGPKTWKRSGLPANKVSLFVGDEEQLPLEGVQTSITVDGFRARVLMDCFFYNNSILNREGTFKLKLPQGATPYYMAFGESVFIDKNGVEVPSIDKGQIDFSAEGLDNMRAQNWKSPKEAIVVEKVRAAWAYGNEVDKQVDPALAEWAGADVYNCSVFPLLPEKLHRIVIGYDVNLISLENDWLLDFEIPNEDCTQVFDVSIKEIPQVGMSLPDGVKTDSYLGYSRFRMINPEEEMLSLRYKDLGNIILNDKNGKYFAAAFTPELPEVQQELATDNAVFALDISLSSDLDKFNIWLGLLEQILRNNPNEIKTFNVNLFNIESFWWKEESVPNTPENIEAFLQFANTLILEGASDIGLALSTIADVKETKNIFLLSDGAITWGNSDPYFLSQYLNDEDVLFAYNTGMSGTGIDILNHLTRQSGGAVFSIAGEDELGDASTAFRKLPWKIKNVRVKGARDILLAGRPLDIYPGQKIVLSGRSNRKVNTPVELILVQGGKRKTFTIQPNAISDSDLSERIFGEMATDHLEEFGNATKEEAIAFSKYFKVPKQTCSLLMLETEQDYVDYKIDLEADISLVNTTRVKDAVRAAQFAIGEKLGDSKAKFMDWLADMSEFPGLEFNGDGSLDALLVRLDGSDFTVHSQGIQSSIRKKSEISENTLKLLKEPRLDYMKIVNQTEERLKISDEHSALKLLSSLVEKNPGDAVIARDVAYSAMEWEMNDQAFYLLERMKESRPYEPQTYHALAQALTYMGKRELAMIYYEIIEQTEWNSNFGEFKTIARLDYLKLLKEVAFDEDFKFQLFAKRKYKKIYKSFDWDEADIMVTISWNTDDTDIDLHMTEPSGETCSYKKKETSIGGIISDDVTQGYGPEMYVLKHAIDGKYKLNVDYYSDAGNRSSARTKVFVTIVKNWGKENEEIFKDAIMLSAEKEMQTVMEFEWMSN